MFIALIATAALLLLIGVIYAIRFFSDGDNYK